MTRPTASRLDADAILEGLDPEQREVAAHPRGPMVVLAGAGTGKTRAITHRIAYGVATSAYHPQRVLAVTFTARAAGEMRTRLRALGVPAVQARTFHAAALRQLQYFWPQAVGGPPPQVISHKIQTVAEATGRLGIRLDRAGLRDVAAEIEWAKVSMLTPQTYREQALAAGRSPAGLDTTAMSRVMETYHEVCAERHVIDFEDVLLLTVGMLDEHPRIAAQIHEQYRHFVVDEYQDVNPLQQSLLDLWLGQRGDLCVVGDPAQSIYSFTGASANHLLTFTRRHPQARRVRLVRNYRSTPQIIHLANQILSGRALPAASASAPTDLPGHSSSTVGAPGIPGATGGQFAGGVELVAQRPDGPTPRLLKYADDVAEAQGLATQVQQLLGTGIPASQVAVLYRTNSQSEVLESALARADIPYLVRGGERFFSRAEVRRGILLLRGAVRSDDGRTPLPEVARAVLTGAGWSPAPPAQAGATRERWESLQALVLLAEELAATAPGARTGDLVAELDRRAAEQHAPTVEGITLASLHAAKGLEWDVVFLVGCSEGLLPITLADTAERIEEERRLLYVGITRARSHLFLSYADARTPGARASRSVSRFLAPAAGVLGHAATSTAAEGGSTRGRSRRKTSRSVRTCRICKVSLDSVAERKIGRCQNCPATYDEATFERLRAWRKEVANASGLPAFVVFTDATLTAIAEREPTDLQGLRAISGVGARKLSLYGQDVLAILGGEDPPGGNQNKSDTSG